MPRSSTNAIAASRIRSRVSGGRAMLDKFTLYAYRLRSVYNVRKIGEELERASVTMKAIANDRYGPPEHLRFEDRAIPEVEPDSVLLRVRAASINPYDWHQVRGTPLIVRLIIGLRGPQPAIPGIDVAGIVEEVGAEVTEFRPGDEVIGSCSATFAEYVCGPERNLVVKPALL